jgi:hypothetical protein
MLLNLEVSLLPLLREVAIRKPLVEVPQYRQGCINVPGHQRVTHRSHPQSLDGSRGGRRHGRACCFWQRGALYRRLRCGWSVGVGLGLALAGGFFDLGWFARLCHCPDKLVFALGFDGGRWATHGHQAQHDDRRTTADDMPQGTPLADLAPEGIDPFRDIGCSILAPWAW